MSELKDINKAEGNVSVECMRGSKSASFVNVKGAAGCKGGLTDSASAAGLLGHLSLAHVQSHTSERASQYRENEKKKDPRRHFQFIEPVIQEVGPGERTGRQFNQFFLENQLLSVALANQVSCVFSQKILTRLSCSCQFLFHWSACWSLS